MGIKTSAVLCCSPEQHSINLSSSENSIRAYPDDEPLIYSTDFDMSHSLQYDHLVLSFKPYTNIINLSKTDIQEFPCLFQLTPPIITEKQGLDIVYIIEVSTSMNPWLTSVSRCISYSLKQLNKCDRVSIVAFNDTAMKLLPLSSVTMQSQSKILSTLKLIQGTGGCNLNEGLTMALNILGMRRMCNTISSLILFSKCEEGVNKIKEIIQNAGISTNFFINVFGLGEHSTEVLSSLSSETMGNYYNVPHPSTLFQAFGSCFGDLNSLYVDRLKVDVEQIRSNIPVSLEKCYECRQFVTYGKPAQLCILLNIMPCSMCFKQNFVLKLLKITVKYRIIPSGEEVRDEIVFEVPLNSYDNRSEIFEVHQETVVELYRVRFAEVLYEVLFEDSDTASASLERFYIDVNNDWNIKDSVCVAHIAEECKNFYQLLKLGWNQALRARIVCSMKGFMDKSLFYYEDFQNSSQISHQSSLKELSESHKRSSIHK